jgi:hypothetical protein
MQHEIKLALRVIEGDFDVAADTRTDHGKMFVSFGRIFALGMKLQQAVASIRAPSLEGNVLLTFEDYEGKLWAGQEQLESKADGFWSTTWMSPKGEEPVMPNRRAWIASRAWLMCRLHSAQRHFPEIFEGLSTEEFVRNCNMQRPSPHQRAFARLHDQFGYPRVLRFSYDTLLDVVSDVASV